MTNLRRLFRQAVYKAMQSEGVPAIMGKADGTVPFTDDNGVTHEGRDWVRISIDGSMEEVVVRNTVAPRHAGLPVRIAERNGVDTIIRVENLEGFHFGGGKAVLPAHNWTHGRFGPDPLYVTGPSFLPLMATPASPPDMTVVVQRGWCRWRGERKVWTEGATSSLSAYVPSTANVQHFVIVCLDRANNALVIVDGTDKTSLSRSVPFTASDVSAVTIPNDEYYPICAVRFYEEQTTIRPSDIFMDLRPRDGENLASSQDLGWMGAVGMLRLFPGLRGLWPMSSAGSAGSATDLSGHGQNLSLNGDPVYNVDNLAPYAELDGSGDYFSKADAAIFDITGTEAHIASAIQGLTLGGWFWRDVAGTTHRLIGKFQTTGDERSYLLQFGASDVVEFYVSSDGTGPADRVQTSTINTGEWIFIAARFTPSTELKAWVNNTTATETTSISASIFDSAADFVVGASDGGAFPLDGRASLCFLCAAAVPDAIIENFYERSKALFS